MSLSKQEFRRSVRNTIAEFFSLSSEEAELLTEKRFPEISINTNNVEFGSYQISRILGKPSRYI